MGKGPYLAMTAAEIGETVDFPHPIGWMACHFSSGGTGLSNLPRELPAGSVLILDDSTPFHDHEPERILDQLQKAMERYSAHALVLDLQRSGCSGVRDLVRLLSAVLPCPVAVTPEYAAEDSAIFLPPVPASASLSDWMRPWTGRALWLELALDAQRIRVTADGAKTDYLPHFSQDGGLRDSDLCCHYQLETTEDMAEFTLWRTREDVLDLAAQAQVLGVNCLGLFQELGEY